MGNYGYSEGEEMSIFDMAQKVWVGDRLVYDKYEKSFEELRESKRQEGYRLIEELEMAHDYFLIEFRDSGCTCFISPPCGYCTHPGNPLNLEDANCWELVEKEVDIMSITRGML